MNIAIVDYGMGNPGSILNMLNYLDIEAAITANPEEISHARKIILPGVGAFDNGMANLRQSGLINVLNRKVMDEKTPVLGICLGMQLMTAHSEEGKTDGLGWINARTVKFRLPENINLKVPHTGWNRLDVTGRNPVSGWFDHDSKFYFVHSYHVVCNDETDSVCKTTHGIPFDSVFAHDNIFGCQFHPEKSHKYGMKVFKNFDKL